MFFFFLFIPSFCQRHARAVELCPVGQHSLGAQSLHVPPACTCARIQPPLLELFVLTIILSARNTGVIIPACRRCSQRRHHPPPTHAHFKVLGSRSRCSHRPLTLHLAPRTRAFNPSNAPPAWCVSRKWPTLSHLTFFLAHGLETPPNLFSIPFTLYLLPCSICQSDSHSDAPLSDPASPPGWLRTVLLRPRGQRSATSCWSSVCCIALPSRRRPRRAAIAHLYSLFAKC